MKKSYIPTFVALITLCVFGLLQSEVFVHEHDMLRENDVQPLFLREHDPLLAILKEIVALADAHDSVVHMSLLIKELEDDVVASSPELLSDAIDEAFDVLEEHHAQLTDEHLEKLIENLMMVWDRIVSEDDWITYENHMRGCSKKSKSFCNITVQGRATIDELNVVDNATFGGNVTIDGTLTVGGILFTQGFVQGGNSFGATALLGTNDAFGLNIETKATQRIQISSAGTVNVVAPDAGVALTVNANALSGALTVLGGAGATAATITPGANRTGLSIDTSGTAAGLILNGGTPALSIVAGGATIAGTTSVTGATTITGTTNINTTGAAVTSIATGGTGALNLGNATGNTAVTGNVTVSNVATINNANTYPLFASGTQVAQTAFTATAGQTNTFRTGMQRMIWAHLTTALGIVTAIEQTGGITSIGAFPHVTGVYQINYAAFATNPIVLATAMTPDVFVTVTTISTTSAVLGVYDAATNALVDADFNVLIMGVAS